MAISGHKSESSIRSYATTSNNTKRKLAQPISSYGSIIKPTFDFGIKYTEDDDDEPPRKLLECITISSVDNVTTIAPTSNHVPDEKPPTNRVPMSFLIDNYSVQPVFNNCYFNF